MGSKNSSTKVENQHRIIDQYSTLETVVYWIMSILCWAYGYLTLIPYFIKYGSFKNIHLNDTPSLCVEDKGKHEKIFRNRQSLDDLCNGFPDVTHLGDLIKRAARLYGSNQFIGKRKILEKLPFKDNTSGRIFKKYRLGEYEWKSFNEIAVLAEHFKNGLLQIDNIWTKDSDMVPKMAIFAKNSEEWVVSKLGIFVVTIFSNMDDSSIIHALNQTRPDVLIVDKSSFKRIISLGNNIDGIKNVIVIGKNVDKSNSLLTNKGINIWSYHEITSLGETHNSIVVSITQPTPDDLALIMYTSGSTGQPKVMLSLILGFKIGHCRTLTLFDNSPGLMDGTEGDFTVLKPTGSFFVPLIADRLVKAVFAKIRTKKRFIQFLFDFALQYKIYFLKMGHLSAPIIDNTLFSKVRKAVGGHLKLVYSAGGPIPKEISFIFSSLFNVNLKQVYGTTETFGAGTFSDFHGPYSLDCGAVSPAIEIKLIPWEEGNYYPDNKPNPRGEICVYGSPIAQGYYQMKDETDRKFVLDKITNKRWYRTGDIAEFLPNGNFRIIDRKENIIKLTGGEFVSLTNVENAIYNSSYVETCCCVPSPNYDSLVAIISPKRALILDLVMSQHHLPHVDDLDQYINDPEIEMVIINDIKSRLSCLTKWEKPSKFVITPDVWTPENELLTSVFKIRRHKIKMHYQNLI